MSVLKSQEDSEFNHSKEEVVKLKKQTIDLSQVSNFFFLAAIIY